VGLVVQLRKLRSKETAQKNVPFLKADLISEKDGRPGLYSNYLAVSFCPPIAAVPRYG